ncbi:hypothetical protein B0H10DRAFT_2032786, partial [Mycena sp. CBHHK59/15]
GDSLCMLSTLWFLRSLLLQPHTFLQKFGMRTRARIGPGRMIQIEVTNAPDRLRAVPSSPSYSTSAQRTCPRRAHELGRACSLPEDEVEGRSAAYSQNGFRVRLRDNVSPGPSLGRDTAVSSSRSKHHSASCPFHR